MPTNRVKLRFILQEYSPREVSGKLEACPFILLETHSNLPGVASGFMGLDLRDEVTFDEARRIVTLLNEKIEYLTHTAT
jgi:hypothetical protein